MKINMNFKEFFKSKKKIYFLIIIVVGVVFILFGIILGNKNNVIVNKNTISEKEIKKDTSFIKKNLVNKNIKIIYSDKTEDKTHIYNVYDKKTNKLKYKYYINDVTNKYSYEVIGG